MGLVANSPCHHLSRGLIFPGLADSLPPRPQSEDPTAENLGALEQERQGHQDFRVYEGVSGLVGYCLEAVLTGGGGGSNTGLVVFFSSSFTKAALRKLIRKLKPESLLPPLVPLSEIFLPFRAFLFCMFKTLVFIRLSPQLC